jgi:uncharacterized protein YceH (UPF0502 family)
MNLSASETRVLGCMLEKQLTTPDIYPLTLNSLRLACNQSTNRDPVVEYDDAILRDALHRLERRGLTRLASGRGSRAPKYRHLLAEALPLAGDEQAVMSVLMLRGPQTPGELKQRADRMHSFAELAAVHETLDRLIARGLVACLERRPGQKEDRYAQLLEDREAEKHANGASLATQPVPAAVPATGASSYAASGAGAVAPIDGLEERIARLEREVAVLRARLGAQEHKEEPPALSSDTGIDTDTALEIDPEPSHEPMPRAWS